MRHPRRLRTARTALLLAFPVLLMAACAAAPDSREAAAKERLLWPPGETLPGGIAPAGVGSSPPPPARFAAPPGLDAYIKIALRRHPAIRAAWERWRAALAHAHAQGWLPEPRFTWVHFIDSIETRTGPQRNRLTLMQAFPWPGKLARQEEAAELAARALDVAIEKERLEVVRQVTRAWAEYAHLARAVAITRKMVALLRGLEPVVQRRIQAGGRQADLLRLQLEIGVVENRLAGLEARRPALSATLRSHLGERGGSLLPWPAAPLDAAAAAADPAPLPPAAALEERLLAGNPELRILTVRIDKADTLRRLADLAGWPDFTLGVTLFDTDEARMAGVKDSGDDPLAVSLGLTLPLWRGKYRAQRRAAAATVEAAHRALAGRRHTLAARLAALRFAVEDRARQVALHRDTLLPRARRALDLTTTAYTAGQATLLDLVDRQKLLLDFHLALWRAHADHAGSLADLTALCGGQLQ